MDPEIHTMNTLFQQLGLNDGDDEVEKFIIRHRPLPRDMELHEASFWNKSQAEFLKQALKDDAEWAELVDELDARLRY
ncbi:Protein of unknown function (DUF2789) [Spongiibacter sp. IMCC21906]|nr:Protein of unknown function (DUF2789) [Spongiibacter sp. IMCC21906]